MLVTDTCSYCSNLTTARLEFNGSEPYLNCDKCGRNFETKAFFKSVGKEDLLDVMSKGNPCAMYVAPFPNRLYGALDNRNGGLVFRAFALEKSAVNWLAKEATQYDC